MSADLLQALRDKLAHLEKMEAHLRFSHGKVAAWLKPDADFAAFDEHQLEALAAFKARFAELQDHLGSAMKLVAEIEAEDTRRFTYVVNYMEQLGILPSYEAWMSARDLRNRATHDYASSDADKLGHFLALHTLTEDLFKTRADLSAFVEQHYQNRKSPS